MEFDTTYMSKDQIAYLTSWPDQTKWPEGAVRCPRCLGSGRYSFNPRDGYKCFWCACIGHDGYILPSSPYYSWVASAKRFEVRGIGYTFKTNDHQQLVSSIEKACEIANNRGCQDMPIRVVDWEFDDIVEYHYIDGAWRKACLTPPPPPQPDTSVCKHCGVHIDFTYKGELICEKCIKAKKCEECGYPVDEPDDKYCYSCYEKQHKQYWDARNAQVEKETREKQAQLKKIKEANPNHDSICDRFDCTVCETMRTLNREIERLGEEWVRIDNELQAYY